MRCCRVLAARIVLTPAFVALLLCGLGARAGGQTTPTPTPRPPFPLPTVHIDVGSAIGRPGDAVDVAVSLAAFHVAVVATQNEITVNTRALDFEPSDCRINPVLGQALMATLVREDERSKTVRFSVQPTADLIPIPDGPLYTCTIRIAPTAQLREFRLTNDHTIAFTVDGTQLAHVDGANGSVTVTLVLPPTATPTPTPTPTATATPSLTRSVTGTPTPTIDRCPHTLVLTPGAVTPGSTIHLRGRCHLMQGGRKADVFFDTAAVGALTGDATGNYETEITIPADATVGTHRIRVVQMREIASAEVEVTTSSPLCVGDCNGDQRVTVDELVVAVNAALGSSPVAACPMGDANHDGQVSVDELVAGVQNALGGCSSSVVARARRLE
jgi:hypothetical protein